MVKSSHTTAAPEHDSAIAQAIDCLTEEVRVLRQTMDELREEIQWSVRNFVAPQPDRLPDPSNDTCAEDSGNRDDALPRADVPQDVNSGAPADSGDAGQFEHSTEKAADENVETQSDREDVEQLEYCCKSPNLQWYGEPDAPGIGCAHCGFLVAQEGDIVCGYGNGEQSEEAEAKNDPSVGPESQQRKLF